VAARAVRQIIDRLCDGSVEQLVVGMVDNEVIDKKNLAALARKIAKRKPQIDFKKEARPVRPFF
jgi:BlaI family penicillinase repressor